MSITQPEFFQYYMVLHMLNFNLLAFLYSCDGVVCSEDASFCHSSAVFSKEGI
ncbi:hypothetical protein SLEP1_g42720 [Rubroshorea leprosula]|uniref:Uncharacterized protein n=1 Tax=Rubroshorea leprosula TaxID=152421 RepID=A0AAV5LBR0_9ROSI|nr:hypothetical protein SLEP1_g42720 [Rubroshorea leprosula]